MEQEIETDDQAREEELQMFAMTRIRLIVAFIVVLAFSVVLALSAFSSTASATHTWSDYHWGHKDPIVLQLDDNLSSIWKPYLATASSSATKNDWSDSSVLDTKIAASTNTKQCSATSGRVEVCNAKYGKNGWIGLASIWTSSGHIVQGTAKMNDSYYMDSYTKQQVMCQEVGHTFGLGHQDTSRSSTFDSCMTYDKPTATTDQWPDTHDYQQLESIYNAHTDSSNTFSTTSTASRLPAQARAVDPSDPAQRGQLVSRSPNGRVEIYERDLGQENKVITRLIRSDEATPAPDTNGGGHNHDDHDH